MNFQNRDLREMVTTKYWETLGKFDTETGEKVSMETIVVDDAYLDALADYYDTIESEWKIDEKRESELSKEQSAEKQSSNDGWLRDISDTIYCRDPLLETLSLVGIESDKQVIPQFHPICTKIVEIGSYDNLFYEGKQIIEISIPDVGCRRLTMKSAEETTIMTEKGPMKDFKSNYYVMGVRQKIDGMSALVFSIKTRDGSISNFYWDDETIGFSIYPCAYFEKCGGCLFLLSEQAKSYKIEAIRVVMLSGGEKQYVVRPHLYSACDVASLSNPSNDGLVLNINGVDTKVPCQRIFSLYYDGSRFRDRNSAPYSVKEGEEVLARGIYDVVVGDFKILSIVKRRKDKEEADTTMGIREIMNTMIVCDQLNEVLSIPLINRLNVYQRFQVVEAKDNANRLKLNNRNRRMGQQVLVVDDVSVLGNEMQWGYLDMEESRVGRVRYLSAGKSYPGYNAVTHRVVASLKLFVSNKWFPCSRRIVSKFVFGEDFIEDVPGVGISQVIYVMRKKRLKI